MYRLLHTCDWRALLMARKLPFLPEFIFRWVICGAVREEEKAIIPCWKGKKNSIVFTFNKYFFTNLETIYRILPTENLFQVTLIFHLEQKFRSLRYLIKNGKSLPFPCSWETSVLTTILHLAGPGMASEIFFIMTTEITTTILVLNFH